MPFDDMEQNEESVRRFWDEVVEGESGARPEDLDPSLAETIRHFHALDDAPASEPALADQIWHELMGRSDLRAPAAGAVVTTPTNGRVPSGGMRWSTQHMAPGSDRTTVLRRRVGGLVRGAAVGTLAGMGAGLLGVGVGARIIMRISAIAAGASQQGVMTEQEGRVGEITFGGTFSILMFGMLVGILGGLIFVAAKPWLPGSSRWRGLIYGSILLVTFGSVLMEDGNNPDYRRFGPPELNITLFCLLFIAFGLLVAPLAVWLDRVLPDGPIRRPLRLRTVAGYALIGGAGLIGLQLAVLGGTAAIRVPIDSLEEPNPLDLSLVAGALGLLIARALLTRLASRIDPAVRLRASSFAAYAGLAIPSLVGFILTVQAISKILGADV